MLLKSDTVHNAWAATQRTVGIKLTIKETEYDASDITSMTFDSGAMNGEALALGSTYQNTIKVVFSNLIEGLALTDEITPELGIKLPDGTWDYTPLGVFVIDAEVQQDRNNNTTTVSASDRMCMLGGTYESKLTYPAAINDIAVEIANLAAVKLNEDDFARLPTDKVASFGKVTYRDAIGFVAQFAGGFATFDRNGLLDIRQLADPNFDVAPSQYQSKGLTKNEALYRIGGIACTVTTTTTDDSGNETQDTTTLQSGSTAGTQITISNPGMTQDLLDGLYEQLQDLNFYPFSLSWFGDPNLEAGDWIEVQDTAGNTFKTPNLLYSLTFSGGITATSKADTTVSASANFVYKGQLHQIVDNIRQYLNAAGQQVSEGIDEPLHPKAGDVWFKKSGPDTFIMMYKIDPETGTGSWVEEVSTKGVSGLDEELKAAKAKLNADILAAQANLTTAQKNIANLQLALKANDDTQAQLTKDLSANSTILEKAQADIVANTQSLSDLDTKLKANDDIQAQLQTDLAANTDIQAQLTTDLAANTKLINANKESVDAALVTVNETLTQAQTDAETAVKNADLAVTNAQSAVDASGLATQTANAASDAALAAKNLATSTANGFATVQSQAKSAASDAATALSNANSAVSQATTAIGNASDALTQAKSALATANGVQNSIQPAITASVDKAKGELTASIKTVQSGIDNLQVGGRNLHIESTEVAGYWATDGTLNKSGAGGDSRAGDFIAINPASPYWLQYWLDSPSDSNHGWLGFTTWDKDKVFIAYKSLGEGIFDHKIVAFNISSSPNNYQLPTNCAFIKISYYRQYGKGRAKFEKGTIATDWSPAPEDVQAQITTNAMKITANSKEIALSAKQSTVDTLTNQVTDNTSQLKLTATAANLEVTSKKIDTLRQTVTDQGAKLDLTATSAQLKVTENKVDALNKTVSDNSAQLKLTATSAALETQSKRVDTISGQVDTNTAGITAANGEIELKANSSTVDALSDTVKQQGIDIKAAQDQLSLKLTQSDLTNGLNGYATQTWAQQLVTVTANGLEANLSTLKTNVDNLQVGGRNLYVVSTEISGWCDQNGAVAPMSNASVGEYIAVDPKKPYVLQMWNDNSTRDKWIGVDAFDADKVFIRYHSYGTNKGSYRLISAANVKLSIPDNAAFVRISYYSWNDETRVKFEQGSIPTDWSPALEDQSAYTDAKVADFKVTVDGLSTTFAKQKDLDTATANLKVTADGLDFITAVTGKKGENVTKVIADVNSIQNTMTGAGGYTTRLQTLEGFQSTATDNITNLQTQQTTLAGQYTSLIESADNKVRTPWFDDGQTGTWNNPSIETVGGPDSNVQKLTGHSKYLRLWGRDNYEGGVGWFSVTPGEVYYFSGYMGSWGTTYSVGVGLNFVTEDGKLSWVKAVSYPANRKIPMSAIAGSITVPAGAVRAQTWVQIDGVSGADLGWASISGLRISKSASNSQITQLQGLIDQRVMVDGKIAAALSLSADGGGTVTIRGASLYVTAASHFDDASIQSAAIANLDAAKITSGSISSDRLATTKLNADNITSGSISADRLATTKLNASNITSGSINAGLITTGVLSADMILGGTFDASKMTVKNIDAGSITSGSIATALLASTKINADNITSGSIAAERIATTALSATNITSGTLDVGKLTVKNLSADLIATGTLDASNLTVKNLSASSIIGGTFDGLLMKVQNIDASSINTGTLNAANLNVIGLNASAITTGTIKGANLAINLNSGEVLFTKGSIKSTTGTLDIEIEDGTFSQRNSSGAGFLMSQGNLYFSATSFWDALDKNEYALSTLIPDYGYLGFGDMIATKRGMALYGKDSLSLGLIDTSLSVDYFDNAQGFISIKKDDSMTVHGGGKGLILVGGTTKTGTTMPTSPSILVGSNASGDGGGNRIYIDAEYFHVPTSYSHTSSGSANVIVKSDGALVRTSSATKYKTNINRFNSTDMAEKLLSLPQAHWYNKQDMQRYVDDPQHYQMPEFDYGMIAEDLASAGLEDLVVRGDDGELEDIRYDRIAPALLPLLAKMKREIEELKGEKSA